MKSLLIATPVFDVFEHMAFDETLARAAAKDKEQFFLRFYNWGAPAQPSLTFGYAQFCGQIEKEKAQRNFTGALTRRPTGGGVVYHESDLTFSCVFTSTQTRAQEIYAKLHGAINQKLAMGMFADNNFNAANYAPSVNSNANACFQNPVPDDIVDANGAKILGGAIRRFDNIILYQGSLQSPGARGNKNLQQLIIKAIEAEWKTKFENFEFAPQYIINIKNLAQNQYRTEAWNKKF